MSLTKQLLAHLRGRLRFLGLLLFIVGLYAAVGAIWLPHLAQTRWLPQLARQHNIGIEARDISLDPFGFGVSLQYVSIKDAQGQPFLSADQISVDLNLLRTLLHFHPALTVELDAPAIRLDRDTQGQWNLAGLWPPKSPSERQGMPILMTHLSLRRGQVVFHDASQAKPVTTRFTDVELELGDFNADALNPVTYRLAGKGSQTESFASEGTFSLNAMTVDGSLRVNELSLPFWLDALPVELPWKVVAGQLSTQLRFHAPAANPAGVMVELEHLLLAGLNAAEHKNPAHWVRAERIELAPSQLGEEAPLLSLGGLQISDMETSWGKCGDLKTGAMTTDFSGPNTRLQSLALENVELPDGKVSAAMTGAWVYDAETRQLQVDHINIPTGESRRGALSGLTLERLNYRMNEQYQPSQFRLDKLRLEALRLPQGQAKNITSGVITYDAADSRLALDTLTATELQSEWGNLTTPELQNVEFSPSRQDLSIRQINLPASATRWGSAIGLSVSQLNADLADLSLRADQVLAGAIETPEAKLGSLTGTGLTVKGRDPQLTLASGRLTDLQTHQINTRQLTLEALDYQHGGKRFKLKTAELTDAVAQGFIENEAVAILAPTEANTHSSKAKPEPSAQTYPRRARLGNLRIEEARGDLEGRLFAAHLISTGKTELDIIRRKNGNLEIRGLPPLAGADKTSKSHVPALLDIEALQLDDYSVNFYDEKMDPPVRIRFNGLTLKGDDLTSDRENAMEFRLRTQVGNSARFEAEGRLQINPMQLSFRFGLDKLRMRSIEPYWKPLTNIDLQRGNLSLWGDVIARESPELTIDYAGGAEVLEFDSIDRVSRQPALKWDLIKVDGLAISNKPQRFVARVITAENPFARVALDENRQLNLLAALEPPNQASIPRELEALQVEKTPVNKLPSAGVGLLRIKNGKVDFSDRSMKPGFSGEITQFDGTVSGLTSRAGARATLSLSGKFNGNSPVNVFGELDPMDYRDHTDVTAQFKGINLTTFSAYSGKFGGYRIEKGKLDMTLNYQMKDGLMEMTNQAVLDKLTLGDRVDDHASWLVDFALFILKNGDGKIDIDLPVYGDLTDPSFNLWTLYRDALTTLIGKIYYGPANLLNEALNGEDARHFTLSFPPGEIVMTESSVSSLTSIADTLHAKLGSTLDIRGNADPRQDRLALAAKALLEDLKKARRIELRAQGIKLHGAPVPDLADEDYRRLFTAYYREKFPQAPELRAIEKENQKLLSGRPFEAAQRRVLDQWPIDETQLRSLAQDRAEIIRGFLIEEQNIPDERLFLRDVMLDASPDAWVRASLTLESF